MLNHPRMQHMAMNVTRLIMVVREIIVVQIVPSMMASVSDVAMSSFGLAKLSPSIHTPRKAATSAERAPAYDAATADADCA